jgi:hypothetical protein
VEETALSWGCDNGTVTEANIPSNWVRL